MSKELNVYGVFTAWRWKTAEAIIAATGKGDWSPSTAELKAFAESGKGKAEGAVNSYNLLASIIRSKLDRINIFTHANARYLYFSGKVVPGDVEFDTTRSENALDVDYLAQKEEDGTTFSDGVTKDSR